MRNYLIIILLSVNLITFGLSISGCTTESKNHIWPIYGCIQNHFESNILVGFDSEAIGTTTGDIIIDTNKAGQIQIGIESFDKIARNFNLLVIQQVYSYLNVSIDDFLTAGVYPLNVFQLLPILHYQIYCVFDAMNTVDSILKVKIHRCECYAVCSGPRCYCDWCLWNR